LVALTELELYRFPTDSGSGYDSGAGTDGITKVLTDCIKLYTVFDFLHLKFFLSHFTITSMKAINFFLVKSLRYLL
jgi:hypothetical protein